MAKVEDKCPKCTAMVLLEDAVICGNCKKCFHFECALVREAQFRKKSAADKLNWLCVSCRAIRGKIQPDEPTASLQPKTLDDVFAMLTTIQSAIVSVQNEQKNILQQVRELCDSQQYLSEKYDELLIQVNKVPVLEAALLKKEDQVLELQNRLNLMEQYSRRHHLELGNIPVERGEKVEDLIVNVAEQMGLSIGKQEIAASHRLRAAPGKTPSIIVEFVNRSIRNKFFEGRKNLPRHKNKIYVNESLSYHFKNLLRLAKEKAKEHQYRFCWYKNNKVFLKKHEDSKPIIVNSIEDIKNIK